MSAFTEWVETTRSMLRGLRKSLSRGFLGAKRARMLVMKWAAVVPAGLLATYLTIAALEGVSPGYNVSCGLFDVAVPQEDTIIDAIEGTHAPDATLLDDFRYVWADIDGAVHAVFRANGLVYAIGASSLLQQGGVMANVRLQSDEPATAVPASAIPIDEIPVGMIPDNSAAGRPSGVVSAEWLASRYTRGPVGGSFTVTDGDGSEYAVVYTWAVDEGDTRARMVVDFNGVALAIPAEAIPAEAIPAEAIPAEAIPSNAIPSNAIPSNQVGLSDDQFLRLIDLSGGAIPSNEAPVPDDLLASLGIPSNSVPILAIPAEAIPAEAIPAEAIPAEAIPSNGIPSNAIPAEAIPAEMLTMESSRLQVAAGLAPGPLTSGLSSAVLAQYDGPVSTDSGAQFTDLQQRPFKAMAGVTNDAEAGQRRFIEAAAMLQNPDLALAGCRAVNERWVTNWEPVVQPIPEPPRLCVNGKIYNEVADRWEYCDPPTRDGVIVADTTPGEFLFSLGPEVPTGPQPSDTTTTTSTTIPSSPPPPPEEPPGGPTQTTVTTVPPPPPSSGESVVASAVDVEGPTSLEESFSYNGQQQCDGPFTTQIALWVDREVNGQPASAGPGDVQSVSLSWRVGSRLGSTPMTNDGPDVWIASIGPFDTDTVDADATISLTAYVTDNNGTTTSASGSATLRNCDLSLEGG